MPTKLQHYASLADTGAREVTGSRESWMGFLTTAGRLYKYPFEEQLMIYAQRPDAIACAPLETWNKPMNRFVRKGSKGIALIDNTADKPKLRYVFDYADTIDGRYNAKKPFVWEFSNEHKEIVLGALNKNYELDNISTDNFGDIIYGLAQSLSTRYYEDNKRDIAYSAEGSFLEDYDDDNLGVAFREALTVSTAYTMMSRCGINPTDYLSDEDFQPIFDFNTTTSVRALGQAVSTITEEVLREIEVTIKNYERNKTAERGVSHEQYNLQQKRGLSDTRHSNSRTRESINQVRHDAQILPEGTPPDTVQRTGTNREIIYPLFGDRRHSQPEVRADDEPVDNTIPSTGQRDEPHGLGGTYEQPESPSGGNNLQRTDLQLNDESEAPSKEDGAFSSDMTISDDEINTFLSSGSSVSDGKFRIFSYFLHDHDTKEKVEFLKDEYGTGGTTHAIEGAEHSYADWDSKGICIKKGNILNPDAEINLTWTNIVNRIDRLIKSKNYMSSQELDHLPSYERQMLGAGVINFFANLPDDIPRPINTENGMFGDYWGNAIKIGNTLEDTDTVQNILSDMQPIMDNTPTSDRYYEVRKRAFDNLTAFENGMFNLFPNFDTVSVPQGQLSLFPTEAEQIAVIKEAEQITLASFPVTINQNDIDTALINWNDEPDSINRVADYMRENGRSREAAAFLQQEYGKNEFIVTKKGAEPLLLPWYKVQRGIAQLVEAGRFSISQEQAIESETPELTSNQHVETIDGVDFVFTGIAPKQEQVTSPEQTPEGEPTIFPEPEPSELEPSSPKPVFLADKNAVYNLDFSLYNDGDILGYDKNGVEYGIMRMGERNFINTTTKITPMGDILGVEGIPADVLRQIRIANGWESPEPELIENANTEPQQSSLPQECHNFRITDEHLGEGGARTKYNFNITAIKTLQQIESENRLATTDEQEVLSRYVGWGGLPQAFDGDNQSWAKEYTELKSLLSPDEYDSARASTLNAHYTSPTVIKAMYETLERLGVKDGNILEPSCGVGNFLGLIPNTMRDAKLYGVELDSVTGRIAKQLYQDADIKVTGFEKTDTPDAFFDVAIGNVPFGSYKIADKRYDKQNFLVHDYFFAKALDQVRPGGIVAFITSKGTMDKANTEVRKYLAQRAELLGAVRLPNTAFKANAGTEVTSDIIFLQKRDRLIDIQPDWVNTWHNEDGIPVNRYFADNPHMILGKMTHDDRLYGNNSETTCIPIEGADLGEQLREALSSIQGQITEIELDDIDGIQDISIPADPTVRNFSYTVIDNAVYFRENSRMNPVDMPATTLERIKGMVEIRDCVHELIEYQLHDYSDDGIQSKQVELNTLYDKFSRKYGLLSDGANNKAFCADSAYYLLCSLEVIDEDGKLERKSDMFSKRTIKQKTVITAVDTSSEALAVSISQKAKVDMEFMQELTGFSEEKIVSDLTGIIFYDFGNPDRSKPAFDGNTMKLHEKFPLVTADEYLSGNVREKLAKARVFTETAGELFHGVDTTVNIKALEQAQPKDLDASEISVRLGSTWVDKQYIQEFMFELLQPSRYLRYELAVNYSEHTGEWNIKGKTKPSYSDVLANVTYGTSRMNAYKILEESLNLKDVRVYDIKEVDGKETRVLNKKETTLAQQKQEAIKQAFKDWVFSDPERRQTLVKQYNEQFNSTRTREYDGSHIEFAGISPEINLKKHQRDAIARILYGGNTLLAHEVGAGISLCMDGQKRFTRLRSLSDDYSEDAIRERISGKRIVAPKKKQEKLFQAIQPKKISLLIDIQNSIKASTNPGYERWAKIFNLKQAAQTLMFLQENNITEMEILQAKAQQAKDNFNGSQVRINEIDDRLSDITTLQKHIGTYGKTRNVYSAYKKTGYSKKFLAEHEAEIAANKAAKKYFNELKLEKLPPIKTLQTEYATLSSEKKKLYSGYHSARKYMQEILAIKQNAEKLLQYSEATKSKENERS